MMQPIFLLFKIIFLLSLSFPLFGLDRNALLEKAAHVIKSNAIATDYTGKKQVYDRYLEIKEQVKSDFISGNRHADIDLYLLLDGLIDDNIQSLQALLALANDHMMEKELVSSFSYEDAQKLAFALKQNKSAFQSEFLLQTADPKKNCTYIVNGHELKQLKSFRAPSEIPIYVGSYCDDGTFEVKKVQSESMQRQDVIVFSDHKKIFFDAKNPAQVHIPNPRQASQMQKSSPRTSWADDRDVDGKNGVEFGLQWRKFYGSLSSDNMNNSHLNSGAFLIPYTKLYHENIFLEIDLSPVDQQYTTLHKSLNQEENKRTQTQTGFFLRSGFGFDLDLPKHADWIDWNLEALAMMSLIKITGPAPNTEIGFGAQLGVGPSFGISPRIKITSQINLGQDFGRIQGTSLGAQLGFNYSL